MRARTLAHNRKERVGDLHVTGRLIGNQSPCSSSASVCTSQVAQPAMVRRCMLVLSTAECTTCHHAVMKPSHAIDINIFKLTMQAEAAKRQQSLQARLSGSMAWKDEEHQQAAEPPEAVRRLQQDRQQQVCS